jgi:ABC-2 type transport system permease protein
MTSTSLVPEQSPASILTTPVEVHAVTQIRVLRSEWIKLWTLRSTLVVLALTVLGVIGIASLVAALTDSNFAAIGQHNFDPIDQVFHGADPAQLALGVFGVLFISAEYSTGMIRATLAAVPTRLPVLWAKLAVFASVTFTVCLAASFVAFFAGEALLRTHGVSIAAPGALRAVFGVALYLTGIGLLGVAFGFIVRNTAGGIATLFAIVIVLDNLSAALPSSWQRAVVPYFPTKAGQAIFTQHGDQPLMHPWAGSVLFVGYIALAVIAAAISLRHRDA